MSTEPRHPTQPVVLRDGVARFKANPIVRHLLDHGGIDLNMLAALHFDDDDRQHFAQLIGYSVSGYADLPYHDEAIADAAQAIVDARHPEPKP